MLGSIAHQGQKYHSNEDLTDIKLLTHAVDRGNKELGEEGRDRRDRQQLNHRAPQRLSLAILQTAVDAVNTIIILP